MGCVGRGRDAASVGLLREDFLCSQSTEAAGIPPMLQARSSATDLGRQENFRATAAQVLRTETRKFAAGSQSGLRVKPTYLPTQKRLHVSYQKLDFAGCWSF